MNELKTIEDRKQFHKEFDASMKEVNLKRGHTNFHYYLMGYYKALKELQREAPRIGRLDAEDKKNIKFWIENGKPIDQITEMLEGKNISEKQVQDYVDSLKGDK